MLLDWSQPAPLVLMLAAAIKKKTTNLGVRSSNLFGRASYFKGLGRAHLGKRLRWNCAVSVW
jgi:hypothetical protein